MSPRACVVLCTCPVTEATRVARSLLEERLVACVNIVPGVRSLYWWKDEVAEDDESLLVIKTTDERYPAVEEHLARVHPYEVPEILALAPEGGLESYLSWVRESVAC